MFFITFEENLPPWASKVFFSLSVFEWKAKEEKNTPQSQKGTTHVYSFLQQMNGIWDKDEMKDESVYKNSY